MARSKFRLGNIIIDIIKLGSNDTTAYLGDNKVYPFGGTFEDAVVTCDSVTYDGNNHTAQNIVVTLNGDTLTQNVDYVISSNTGGTNAGNYTVVVDGIGDYSGTTTGTFTISPKQVTTPTIELSPTAYTYNGDAFEPTVTVKDSSTVIDSNEYTVEYRNNINAGTAVVAIIDNVGGNYNVSGYAGFTINKANGSVTTVPTAKRVYYTGYGQELVNAGSGTGTMLYKLGSSSWSSSIPTASTLGDYTVYYKASASINYNESESGSVSCSITEPIAIKTKYDVKDATNPTRILSSTTSVSRIYIDGVAQPSVSTGYTFDTIGEHTVDYSLTGTSMDSSMFYQCYDMTSAEILNNVTNVTGFFSCSGLTSCTIGNGATTVNGFSRCSSLTSISIPNSVTSIGIRCFEHCYALTSINIPNGVTTIGNGTFQYCTSLTSIADFSFNSCYRLSSCTIGSGVTNIGGNAFSSCTSLQSVGVIGSGASIEIPDTVTTMSYNVFADCFSISSCTFSNGLTEIGRGAFYRCCSLYNDVNIPSSVTSINDSAFQDCTELTSVTIPDSVTTIGSYAFGDCDNLRDVTVGSGVTSIGDSAFTYCSAIRTLVMPSALTSIGEKVFEYCSRLSSITCNATTAPTIDSSTFQNIRSNGTLTVPSGSSGYDTWMQNANYYLGSYNWTKVEQ